MVGRQGKHKDKAYFIASLEESKANLADLRSQPLDKLTEQHKSFLLYGILRFSKRQAFLAYSAGRPIEEVLEYAAGFIKDTVRRIEVTGKDVGNPGDLEQYIHFLTTLSMCYFTGAPEELTNQIYTAIPYAGKDMLVDRLYSACIPGSKVPVLDQAFPRIYGGLAEFLDERQTLDERNEKLKAFVDGYYASLNGKNISWHGSHQQQDFSRCIYDGYWLFEVAALLVDLGWDDSHVREHFMYPKDMADWRRDNDPSELGLWG